MERILKKDIGLRLGHSYAALPEIFYVKRVPDNAPEPKLVIYNEALGKELGLNIDKLSEKEAAGVFSGALLPEEAEPIALSYAGHQFGQFTILGDGRAMLLGEHRHKEQIYDIHLKGAGRTSHSRGGDGKAALGPMLREYLMSEAMHALDIPTTRALAVATTGEEIVREDFLPGAVLTRVASSHLRVGTFEFATVVGKTEAVKALADYTIKRHYPHLENLANPYYALFQTVIKKQATLIAKWQLVGFIHGVMNTDNMTISGETIDYGPCAFIDRLRTDQVFSSIDTTGRYAYGNQPKIGQWNLTRFAESLLSLIDEDEEKAIELAKTALSHYGTIFQEAWLAGMRAKLGLFHQTPEDDALITRLLQLMEKYEADYTNTFRALTLNTIEETKLYEQATFREWLDDYRTRLVLEQKSASEVEARMKAHNPSIIPRNYYVEEALAAAEKGDMRKFNTFMSALANPYAYTTAQEAYVEVPSDDSYTTYCGT